MDALAPASADYEPLRLLIAAGVIVVALVIMDALDDLNWRVRRLELAALDDKKD